MVNSSTEVAMASCDNGSDEHARARSWLGETLHPFNFIAVLRERYQIRRICAHSLKLYRPGRTGNAGSLQYGTLCARHRGAQRADSHTVQGIMRRTEESFATWPVERPLTFRDIVQYIAVTGGLKADIAVTGVRSRYVDSIFDIVAGVIRQNL